MDSNVILTWSKTAHDGPTGKQRIPTVACASDEQRRWLRATAGIPNTREELASDDAEVASWMGGADTAIRVGQPPAGCRYGTQERPGIALFVHACAPRPHNGELTAEACAPAPLATISSRAL
jgi:hypothetical protein